MNAAHIMINAASLSAVTSCRAGPQCITAIPECTARLLPALPPSLSRASTHATHACSDLRCLQAITRRLEHIMPPRRVRLQDNDPRRKRFPLSLEQKGKVLDMLAQGKKLVDVASHFRVKALFMLKAFYSL